MIDLRPTKTVFKLSEAADRVWGTMEESDWMDAFAWHPRIGAQESAQSVLWSHQEPAQATAADERLLAKLAEGNALYEQRFAVTYIVCATCKKRRRDARNSRVPSQQQPRR